MEHSHFQNATKKYRLGVLGGGFMASAIVDGAIEKAFLLPKDIILCDRHAEKRALFQAKGVHVTDDCREAAQSCSYLLLAVKPQGACDLAETLKGSELPVLISILAGKSKASLKSLFSADKIARVMPNLPCAVGEGVSGIDAGGLEHSEQQFVFSLFDAVGKTVPVEEPLMDAVTGVSGSGPAYVYLFLKALTEAGIAQGLSREQAKMLAIQTVKGGVAMAERSQKGFEELIEAVSSKGGTTSAALDSFEADDFAGSIARAVDAAVKRAGELG